jgi:hypothetical protein
LRDQQQHGTRTNEFDNSSTNNYLNFSLFPAESIDSDGRGKKKNTTNKCGCWLCHDTTVIIEDEIKSLQKSLSHTKEDTNKILDEIKN